MLKKEILPEDEFISVMEKKYHEKFQFLELEGSHFGSSDRAAYLSCESFPEERIWARRVTLEDGERHYSDNYMGYYYRNDIEDMVRESVKAVNRNCKVSCSIMESYIPVSAEKGQSLEKMLKEEGTVFSVEITVCGVISRPEREILLECWRKKLKEQQLRLKGIFKDESEQFCFFAMDRAYEFLYAGWR